MYYIMNLETRAVLTYPNGSRIIEANAELATSKAVAAQEYQQHRHTIVAIAQFDVDALGREVAPWFSE